jgi:hypothetical protein
VKRYDVEKNEDKVLVTDRLLRTWTLSDRHTGAIVDYGHLSSQCVGDALVADYNRYCTCDSD